MSCRAPAGLLALFLLAAAAEAGEPFRPDPVSVRRYGPAYRYPQNGWTVLHVEGEPFDRGYQHGRLMAAEIADYVKTLATEQSAKDPAAGWRLTRTLVGAAFLRKFDREYLDEMRGIADGAAAAGATFDGRPVDLTDVAAVNLLMEYDTLDAALDAQPTGLEGVRFPRPPAPRCCPPPQKDHCSAFAATGPATAGGKMVIGHITMFGLATAHHANVWLDVKPAKGHRVLMQSYPGGIQSGMDYYQNSAGIVVTETTIRQTRYNPDGAPLASRIRKALQYGSTIDDVVKELTERNNGLYTNEWLIGDANTNEIAVLELGTTVHRLRRSSKNEWLLPGTEGFYWGCNNTKDLKVRLDTVASLTDRPQNVSWAPSDRDKAWLRLFQQHRGKIDADFGKKAFALPPLSAHPSLDAKVTTSDLAKRMESHAVFGPPYARVWAPTFEELTTHPGVHSLVPNDWTVLGPDAPAKADQVAAVDVSERVKEADAETQDPPTVPAWHGTLLPKSDADLWLTAGFAEYERVVALEAALKERSDGTPTDADKERVELALFRFRADYQSAKALAPTPPPGKPDAIAVELDRDRWHREQVAYGVLALHAVREFVGAAPFADAMDAFGRANAGKEVAAADFAAFLGKQTGKDVAAFLAKWPGPSAGPRAVSATAWMRDPEAVVIVYGTLGDAAANDATANALQKAVRDQWSNFVIPVKADRDVTDADLAGRHVVLIGRPATNAVTKRFEPAFPVKFGPASASVRGKVYAHDRTAVVAAGANPADGRYAAVVLAGLSADTTYHAVAALMKSHAPASDVLVIVGGKVKPVPATAKPADLPASEGR